MNGRVTAWAAVLSLLAALAAPGWCAFDDLNEEARNIIRERRDAQARFEGEAEARQAEAARPDDVIRVVRMTHVGGREIETLERGEAAAYTRRVTVAAAREQQATASAQAGFPTQQFIWAFVILVAVGLAARLLPSRQRDAQ